MKKILLIALLAVAVMAVPAFASVQNIKISGDIDSTFLVRDQFDLGTYVGNGNESGYQNLLITQTRLRVDADLTENVSAVVALINERVWGEENNDQADSTDIDLNLAYVTLREMLYSPLTVVVGRQNFKYGNSFVVDSAGMNMNTSASNGLTNVAGDLTKRTAQDAIRLILDYDPLTLELLASKVDSNNSVSSSGAMDDDVDLFGVNANYQLGDDYNSVIESYFFARLDRSTDTSVAGTKADSLYTWGLRGSTNPIKGLNTQLEYARQLGNKATTHTAGAARADNMTRDAWATQVIGTYVLPFEKTEQYNPIIMGSYSYYSGDDDPAAARAASDNYTAWDPLYENQAGGTIYNSLFASTNCHVWKTSLQMNPIEDITFKSSWTGLWLAKDINPAGNGGQGSGGNWLQLFQPDQRGTYITPTVESGQYALGYEVDFDFLYDYTEDVQVGLNMGWFFPGAVFDNSDVTAKQFLANVNVNF